jgi:hypothetical protein
MTVTRQRIAALLVAAGLAMPLSAAEIFYMDHDLLTGKYVGDVGPLVLSGEIVSGDYDRLLAKIALDPGRYLEQNKLIVASPDGDVPESLRVAALVKALLSEVTVDPQTGPCVGACFLIYAAASERASDGPRLIGVHRLPGAGEFLAVNGVPAPLLAEIARHTREVYWLTPADEQALGHRSPAFARYLKTRCAWDAAVERDVFSGKTEFAALSAPLECRARATQSDARQALARALAGRSSGR